MRRGPELQPKPHPELCHPAAANLGDAVADRLRSGQCGPDHTAGNALMESKACVIIIKITIDSNSKNSCFLNVK